MLFHFSPRWVLGPVLLGNLLLRFLGNSHHSLIGISLLLNTRVLTPLFSGLAAAQEFSAIQISGMSKIKIFSDYTLSFRMNFEKFALLPL